MRLLTTCAVVLSLGIAFVSGCASRVHQTSFRPVIVKSSAPKPAPVVRKIDISDKIHFRTMSAELEQRSHGVLDEVAKVLSDNPALRVEIQGHTDSRGSDRRNRELSQRRAEAVMHYLVERGIEEQRLDAVGRGEEIPVADNGTDDGRSDNRRVEFVVKAKLGGSDA